LSLASELRGRGGESGADALGGASSTCAAAPLHTWRRPTSRQGLPPARLVCSGLAAREMQPRYGSAGVASSWQEVSKGVYAASRSSCLKPGTREASQSGAGREGWRLAV
jgi:hypothetical protein